MKYVNLSKASPLASPATVGDASSSFVLFFLFFVGKLFSQKQQGESCEGSILVRNVDESEISAYLIHHHIVNINQPIILLLLPL